ncbi:MAG: SEC-C metal-binding domain-containing protein [Thermomicrobiales bacterium]
MKSIAKSASTSPIQPNRWPPPSSKVSIKWCEEQFGQTIEFRTPLVDRQTVLGHFHEAGEARYRPELREVERTLLLQFLDTGWKDHLYAMDHLRSGIGLVGYAQIDPKVQYKREGKTIFERMWETYEDKVTSLIFRLEDVDPNFVSNLWRISNVEHQQYQEAPPPPPSSNGDDIRQQQEAAVEASKGNAAVEPIRNRDKKVGRNDPCPCGSGKKFKNCCMGRAAVRSSPPTAAVAEAVIFMMKLRPKEGRRKESKMPARSDAHFCWHRRAIEDFSSVSSLEMNANFSSNDSLMPLICRL